MLAGRYAQRGKMKELNKLNKADFVKTAKAISVLDAIISPEWEYRYYSFNSKWSDNEFLASMRDGQGRYWYALITDIGIAITGNAKDKVNNIELSKILPKEFINCFWNEPAFETQNSSFVAWKLDTDNEWTFYFATDNFQNINSILEILLGNPYTYKNHSLLYFEKELDIKTITKIYNGVEIDNEIIKKINDKICIEDIKEDFEEIGYENFG